MDILLRETQLTNEEDPFEDIIGLIYTEKSSSLLYEVKFFKDFAIVRPASPTFYLAIRNMSLSQFADEFEEYLGDHAQVLEYIRGNTPELIVE